MDWVTSDTYVQFLLHGKERLENAPPAAVDGGARIGDHDHARLRLALENAIEWRVGHVAAEERADVEVMWIRKEVNERALALVRPRLECVVDKLEDPFVIRVGEEEVATYIWSN